MKSIIISTLLFLSSIVSEKAFGQGEIENSILWKIEGNDLEKASYLMGTIHIMCEEDFVIKEKILTALENTDNLVLEIDFADPNEMAAMQKMMMSDQKLSETLTNEQMAKLDTILKDVMNIGIEAVDQFTLMAIYSLVMTQSIDCPVKKMWEMELIALANEGEKDIHGLETIEDQSDFFTNAFPQDEMLEQIFIMDDYADIFVDMVSLYNQEKLSELGEVVNDPRFMNEEAEYWMLEKRNKDWAVKMPKLMKEGSNFFAVGSAHLIGEFGMIKLLREQGYNVSPIK